MGSQKFQRDCFPAVFRHAHLPGQVFDHWVVPRHLAALHIVSQEQRGEYLYYRADLEDRVAVERPRVAIVRLP